MAIFIALVLRKPGCSKTKSLLNQLRSYEDINNTYLYIKDPTEEQHQYLKKKIILYNKTF